MTETIGSRRARRIFLTIAGLIALAVGGVALIAPAVLLASKGVDGAATEVWMREVGVLLIALGLLGLSVRNQPASPVLRRVLAAHAVVVFGLLPIEIIAAVGGVIPTVGGIVPNSIVHAVLGLGFTWLRCA